MLWSHFYPTFPLPQLLRSEKIKKMLLTDLLCHVWFRPDIDIILVVRSYVTMFQV